MEAWVILRNVLIATAVLALIAFVLCKFVSWARNREEGAFVLGALFSPFMGFGDVVDPDHKMLNETKQLKQKEEDDSGDPPPTEGEDSQSPNAER